MPTTNFKASNADLDTLFEPIGATTKRADVNYTVNGTDISNYYYSVTNGGTQFGTTNLQAGGIDIGTMFAAAGSVGPYTPSYFLYIWALDNATGALANDTDFPAPFSNNAGNVSGFSDSPTQVGSASWIAISAGGTKYGFQHGLAINSDYKLFSWGRNNRGQLGTNIATIGTSLNEVGNKSSLTQIGSSSWTAVSAGQNQSVAIRSDGLLFAWGDNTYGQLGDGTITRRSSPVQIGSSSWTAVSAGGNTTAAIRSDGRLFTWGRNDSGQLGNNTQTNSSSPVQIGSSSWTAVSVTKVNNNSGGMHTIAIRSDGRLFTWGRNNRGQLGDGTTTNKSSPVQIGSSSWTAVASGGDFKAAIRSDGALFTWGANLAGQLGRKQTSNIRSWVSVSSSNYHVLAIDSNNKLFAWGWNNNGQIGANIVNSLNVSSPVQIGFSSWTAVSAGAFHSLAIRSDGYLFAWGRNYGALGDGTSTHRSSPVQIGSSSWTAIAAGGRSGQHHSMAIRSGGTLFTWGSNSFGQLGDSTLTVRSSPVQIGSSSWTAIAGGAQHSVAIRSDGYLFAWGWNPYGSLGDGTTTNRSSPVQIGSSSWTAIAAGARASLAIRSGGTLFGWGDPTHNGLASENSFNWTHVARGIQTTLAIRSDGLLFSWGNGQVGDGTTLRRNSPVQIGSSSWTAVGAGWFTNFAIRSDSLLFGWGSNGFMGRIGDGTTIDRSSPVQIGSSSWSAIGKTLGQAQTLAIRSDNKLFAWGFNSSGQVGDGTITNRSSPVQIGSSSWTAVGGHGNASAAIRSDGALFTWGQARTISQGTGSNVSSPVQIGSGFSSQLSCGRYFGNAIKTDGTLHVFGDGRVEEGTLGVLSPLRSWNVISAGVFHNLALDSNNKLYGWGQNSYGQLGITVTGNQYAGPRLIDSTNSWTVISCGHYHTFMIRSDGLLYAAGRNQFGQLGDGTGLTRTSFVQIGSSSWTAVSAGQEHTTAIRADGTLFAWGRNNRGQLGDGTTTDRSSPVQIGTSSSWTAVSNGKGRGITIPATLSTGINNGLLFVWGGSSYGGTTSVTTFLSWTALHTNGYGRNVNVFGITSDNLLYAWGNNSSGQLGDGTTVNKSSPVQIGSSSWTAVSAGGQGFSIAHTIAIRSDGALFTWGRNASGQLGDGTTVGKSSPVQIGSSSWISVSAGNEFSTGIDSNGLLYAWGSGFNGRLGDGTTTNKSSPVQIGSSSWTMVRGARAIRSDGLLFTWGDGTNGQLGDGTTANKSSPVQIGSSSWTAIAAGRFYNLAIRSDGRLFGWGQNNFGQVGDSTTINKSSPVQIGSSSWTAVAAGLYNSFGVRSGGTLYAWGNRQYGAIPDQLGTYGRVSSPTQIGSSSWALVGSAAQGGFAIRSGGTFFTWGRNQYGQIGDATTLTKTSPVALGGLGIDFSSPVQVGSSSWTAVNANSSDSVLALRSDNKIFTWGRNNVGQLGDGTTVNKASPVQIGSSSWTAISTGSYHMGALRSDNVLFTWGGNASRQLGNGNTFSRSSPDIIGSIGFPNLPTTATAISLAREKTYFISNQGGFDKLAFYVGSGTSSEELGQNATNNPIIIGNNPLKSTFSGTVQIGSSSWTAVGASNYSSSAIRIDGALFVWGRNQYGSLGIRDNTAHEYTPVPISFGAQNSWTVIAGGAYGFSAISNSSLYSWGRNNNSNVGDGTTINRSSPTLIAKISSSALSPVQIGSSSWTAIAMNPGTYSAMAIRSDKKLFTWGTNTVGQLGIGTDIVTFSPTQVGSSDWKNFGNPSNVGAAILDSNSTLYIWGNANYSRHGNLKTFNNTTASPVLLGDEIAEINTSSPVQVGSGSWINVSAGYQNILALSNQNRLFAWGRNNGPSMIGRVGVLGFGIDANNIFPKNAMSPIQVGSKKWSQISASEALNIATD